MEALSRMVFTFLLNALWQVTLVTALTAIAVRLMQRAPARFRHALWVIGLGLSVLLPFSTLPDSWRLACRSASAAASAQPEPSELVQPSSQTAGSQPTPVMAPPLSSNFSADAAISAIRWLGFQLERPLRRRGRTIPLPPFIPYAALSVYLLVLLRQLTRLARAGAGAKALRRGARGRGLPEELASSAAKIRDAYGLRPVAILASSQAAGPATVGFLNPVIVMPEALLRTAPQEELTSALCHEMAHIQRRDYLVNLLCEFAFLPLAFHPGAWLLKRRIDETRELACDEAAAGVLPSATAYARSLISLAQSIAPLASSLRPRYTLGVYDANILEERIMRLLDNRPRLSPRRARLLLSGATIALALAALAAGMFSLTAVGTAKAASTPGPQIDFSGRWELDASKSDLPSPFPDNLVEVIDAHGADLKVTTTSKDWNASKPIAVSLFALMLPEFSTTTDNKESIHPFGPGQIRSKTRWEGDDLVTDWTLERNSQVAVTGRWIRSLSRDGNTQTIQITAHDPVHNLDGAAKAVFVRRGEDPRAFLGVWRGEFQGQRFVTLNLKSEGNRVTGTMSDFDVRIDSNGNILEATPGAGSGWEIVDALLYTGALHMQCKEAGTGEIDAFGLKLLDEGKAELQIVQPPSNPAPRPLVVTRDTVKNQGTDALGVDGHRAFLGTWNGRFEGKTYIIVNLKETDGSMTGGVSVGGFGIDDSGQVVRVKEQANPRDAVPILNAKLEGALLSFSGKTPDGGSDILFKMKLAGGNAAELKCVLVPAPPPGTPVASWWKLVRESDDQHGISVPGPLGGIVGGATGGVAKGVLDGMVRGVPGGILGGVAGGVRGDVTGGIPGGIPGGVAGGI